MPASDSILASMLSRQGWLAPKRGAEQVARLRLWEYEGGALGGLAEAGLAARAAAARATPAYAHSLPKMRL
jgi:hypothetical protein